MPLAVVVAGGGVARVAAGSAGAQDRQDTGTMSSVDTTTPPLACAKPHDAAHACVWDTWTAYRQQAFDQNSGLTPVGMSNMDLQTGIEGSAYGGHGYDPVQRVVLSPTRNLRTYKVVLKQLNMMEEVDAAIFQDPQSSSSYITKGLSFDMDLVLNKTVRFVPWIKASGRNHFVQLGPGVALPSWANPNPSQSVMPVVPTSFPEPQTAHTGVVTVRIKRGQRKALRSGRVYVEVRQDCAAVDPTYDPGGRYCHRVIKQDPNTDVWYRLHARTSVYLTGVRYAHGDELFPRTHHQVTGPIGQVKSHHPRP